MSESQTEAEFLASYDAALFPSPLVTVDAALFTFHDERLLALAVKRSAHPDLGKWGLPGGFVDMTQDRSLEDAARRVLKLKTGVTPPYIEQLGTYGGPKRDKRGWAVTVCYSALLAYQDCQSYVDTVADAQWVEAKVLARRSLAFDHKQMLADARERLRQKALYSVVPAYALPEEFTLPELQALHEALLEKPLQKKSFRRRIEQAELIVECGERRTDRGRPATLYRLRAGAGKHTFLRNLEA